MRSIFKLVRGQNLIFILLILFSQKYLVFHPYLNSLKVTQSTTFSVFNFILLSLSIVLIAAGGYIYNDTTDIIADRKNKPQKKLPKYLGDQQILNIYYITTISGLAIGIALSINVGLYQLAIPHVVSAFLLYLYSTYLKRIPFLGNLVIAVLAALVPLTYLIFEAFDYIQQNEFFLAKFYPNIWNYGPVSLLISWSFILSFFAFIFTLCREIIKDVEDEAGDRLINRKTLAMVLGPKKSYLLVVLILVLSLFFVFTKQHLIELNAMTNNFLSTWFSLITLVCIVCIVLAVIKQKFNAATHSKLLKIAMLCGVGSSLVLFFII